MKIYLGSDHAGFELKEKLKSYLTQLGHEIEDKGAFKLDPEDDYPDFIRPVAEAVATGPENRGIVIGFGGQGEAITANRVKGIRAIVYYGEPQAVSQMGSKREDKAKDVILLSREDNNANVLALAAGFVSPEEAQKIVKRWLETPFSGEPRHQRRIKKIDE